MSASQGLPYDAELVRDFDEIKTIMTSYSTPRNAAQVIGDRPIDVTELVVPGPPGDPDIVLAVFRRRDHVGPAPIMYYTHGGGMTKGDRYSEAFTCVNWVDRMGIVGVTVEYRLAPAHQHPALVEDCYAGLVWTHAHAAELGGDPDRILIAGASAGGALAAATALLARDRNGPPLIGQYLGCPMLDDRCDSVSMQQFDGLDGVFDRTANRAGWRAVLGDAQGTDDVSPYASPSRATDLAGLPPAFIDVGSCEPFRDPAVDYASRLWAAGVQAELHVWAGGFHGYQTGFRTRVAQATSAASASWFERMFDPLHERP